MYILHQQQYRRNLMTAPFKTPYHFDKFKVDKEGEYSKSIGVFQGDWADEIIHARSKVMDEQQYNTQRYEHAANKKAKITQKKIKKTKMVFRLL